MVVADPKCMLNTEPYPVTCVLGVWSDVRENGEDEFVWEFENWEMGRIITRSEEPTRELVLGLVWGAGDPRDSSGTADGRCFLPRPHASPVKSVEGMSR